MAASFAIVLLVARFVRIDGRLAVLIAVGSAVCGNTAIVATAPVIGARAREVAYAVATITLFGTLAVFLYPAIGHALAMPQPAFGLWAGVAVHDTSQVIADECRVRARARSTSRPSSSSSATRSWRRCCS